MHEAIYASWQDCLCFLCRLVAQMWLEGNNTNHVYHVKKKSKANFLSYQLQVYFAKRYTKGNITSPPICAVGGEIANAFPCFTGCHENRFREKKYISYSLI